MSGFPFFRGAGDLRPAVGSVLVDRAVQLEDGPSRDLDGNPRTAGASADIGAYELVY